MCVKQETLYDVQWYIVGLCRDHLKNLTTLVIAENLTEIVKRKGEQKKKWYSNQNLDCYITFSKVFFVLFCKNVQPKIPWQLNPTEKSVFWKISSAKWNLKCLIIDLN